MTPNPLVNISRSFELIFYTMIIVFIFKVVVNDCKNCWPTFWTQRDGCRSGNACCYQLLVRLSGYIKMSVGLFWGTKWPYLSVRMSGMIVRWSIYDCCVGSWVWRWVSVSRWPTLSSRSGTETIIYPSTWICQQDIRFFAPHLTDIPREYINFGPWSNWKHVDISSLYYTRRILNQSINIFSLEDRPPSATLRLCASTWLAASATTRWPPSTETATSSHTSSKS